MTYLFTCVAGLQDVVWRQLSSDAGPLNLLHREEGLLEVDGQISPKKLTSIGYINNSYLVIAQLKPTDNIAAAARQLLATSDWHAAIRRSTTRNARTFRLVLSDDSRLVGGDRQVVGRLQTSIQHLTNLRQSAHKPDVEFWLLRRRSNKVFLCKRLSRRWRTEKDLQKGELRPEFAHLLCLLSEPQPDDVFLDPFAGRGAIPFARTRYPYNMMFAFDNNENNVRLMKAKTKDATAIKVRKRSPFIVRKADARNLVQLEDGFIDKIVTDPPWGEFDRSIGDLETFYHSFFGELCRVVKPGGILVVLLGDSAVAEKLSRDFAHALDVLAVHKILVAGKKAVIYKWKKRLVNLAATRFLH